MGSFDLSVARSDVDAVAGAAFSDHLVSTRIFRECRNDVGPVVLIGDGRPTLILGAYDAAALDVCQGKISSLVYGDYFAWGEADKPRIATFADAVSLGAGSARIAVDPMLSVARLRTLPSEACLARDWVANPVHAYKRSRHAIELQWSRSSAAAAREIAEFVSTLRFGPELGEVMEGEPLGFGLLDTLMAAAGFDGLYLRDPLTCEMFTGVPACDFGDGFDGVYYGAGLDSIIVASTRPIEHDGFVPIARFADETEFIASQAGSGTVGIEEHGLACGLFARFQENAIHMADASYVIRRWLELRAVSDLPYYIVAANAALRAIEKATGYIEAHAAGGLTDLDVARAYRRGVDEFFTSNRITLGRSDYFEIIHTGERTLGPAVPAGQPIGAENDTVKFDMGLLVADAFGCVRACSDVAGTYSPLAEIRALEKDLRRQLTDDLIPAIRPGMTGDQAHTHGVEALRLHEAAIKSAGLMPQEASVDGYRRDCGHSLQRQTFVTTTFEPNDQSTVEAGMLGCVEYVLPFGKRAFAVEEAFCVSKAKTMPFTL